MRRGLFIFLALLAAWLCGCVSAPKPFSPNRTDAVGATHYFYNADDDPTNVTENGRTCLWTHDEDERIASYTDSNGHLIQYGYDANGNVTNLIYPGGKNVYYTYDSNNHLTQVKDWSGRVTTLTYDLDGRVTGIVRPNGTQRVIGYDAAGQATNILEENGAGFPIALFRFNWNASATMQWEFAGPLPHTNTPPTRNMTYNDDNELATVNGQVELDTPTIGRPMPRKIDLAKYRRWTGFSADEPSESSAYFKLNRPMPCPPRGTVPVNPRRNMGNSFISVPPIRLRSERRPFQLCRRKCSYSL